jgi:hypothetical protein
MTPLCTLLAATFLAAQPPIPDRIPLHKPAQVAVPKPPGFRAAGVAATVGEMRLEQKHLARQIVNMFLMKRQGGIFTASDNCTAVADTLRCAQIEYALAQSEGERIEAVLLRVMSLLEMEQYAQARADFGTGGTAEYLQMRCHRLAAQACLLEEVKADPAVIRRHHESYIASCKKRDEAVAVRVLGGVASEEENLLGADEFSSEANLAASRAATPAERDATNRRMVESLKALEKDTARRIAGGVAASSNLPLVTYFRLDAELRELSVSEKPPADQVRQLGEQRKDAIRQAVKLMSARRNVGVFSDADTDRFRKAQSNLLDSELALAGDAAARRVLLERNLEEAVGNEKYWTSRAGAGMVFQASQHRSTYDRIEAEIRLKLAK